MLASSIDMLSPTLDNFPGRSRGLPPTQFRHSGLLHRSPLLTTSSEELNESVGSVSADTFDSDNESEPLSIDSSHYARRHLSSTQQDDDGLLMESQSVVHESSYYEYTKRLTSRSTSKPESKCNSRRESFGRSEGKEQSPPSKNGEHRSADESSFSEDDRRTFYEHLEEEEEALHMTPFQEHTLRDVCRQSRRFWSGSLSEDLIESRASISGASFFLGPVCSADTQRWSVPESRRMSNGSRSSSCNSSRCGSSGMCEISTMFAIRFFNRKFLHWQCKSGLLNSPMPSSSPDS